ncbi:YodC family protein [Flagellimonas pelagia]|uniref:DUF2158 domain-containing protein n=1 Tax=Flagellimonas pelagia TaxID=2306998 RepID=A0A3A1ND06_9FLAO|nr:DUF2158 domain-containing protein [Allomuricauda maritima]RIV42279.1 DUF2158 domain-containing protein [Allomuricauda maritima]TXJ90713.1 DUF2158 domain-containing protein [Allomuricauda maritima]
MSELKLGDVVFLKSGGPEMTIYKVSERNNQVGCKWFDGKELKYGAFIKEELQKKD